jgi:hypothetical protein
MVTQSRWELMTAETHPEAEGAFSNQTAYVLKRKGPDGCKRDWLDFQLLSLDMENADVSGDGGQSVITGVE